MADMFTMKTTEAAEGTAVSQAPLGYHHLLMETPLYGFFTALSSCVDQVFTEKYTTNKRLQILKPWQQEC